MSLKQSLQLNIYYTATALRDSWRARSTLFTNSVILAGIALLILLLIGLKSGLLQQFRADILKSPTATEIRWWATSARLALDAQGEQQLKRRLPGDCIIIPDITKIVTLSREGGRSIDNVTLQTTAAGDPFLAFHGADIEHEKSRSLVVSPALAQELGLNGDGKETERLVRITVTRQDGSQQVTASIDAAVTAVVGSGDSKLKAAYLSRYYMDKIEDFSQGESVAELGWKGRKTAEHIGYEGYLAFTKRPYTDQDTRRLHLRGMKATKVDRTYAAGEGLQWSMLAGLLIPHKLHVYFVESGAGTEGASRFLGFSATEIEEITATDDVVLYWSRPIVADINNQRHQLIGVSGSMRWLRGYFKSPAVRMNGHELTRLMLLEGTAADTVQLDLPGGQSLTLHTIPPPPEVVGLGRVEWTEQADNLFLRLEQQQQSITSTLGLASKLFNNNARLSQWWFNQPLRKGLFELERLLNERRLPLAIVPAELLTAVHKLRQGALVYDSLTGQFIRPNQPNVYFNGRIYGGVLEDIPVIDEQLQRLGYSTISSRTRVLEMAGYAGTLDLLVNILQVVAVVLGVVTVSVIFMEVTRRRKTSIGIMRVMGMQPRGIFLFVFVRAVMVAVIGWALATVCALAVARGMPLVSNAECRLVLSDFLRVLVGTLVCSTAGVMFHAWHAATRLDPVDAISEGKVQ